jgi:peptidoglycan lytic transglycosylase D
MRVQRAVAGVLLSLCAGCGQAAFNRGGTNGVAVSWGVSDPAADGSAETYGLDRGLDLSERDDDVVLPGQQPLWPTASHPQVFSLADRLPRERSASLRDSISRSSRYLDIIAREFAREGVPPELAYLPIVESNFSESAVGLGGVGLWQLTRGTAQRYGLIVNRDIDERRDPEKASRAAARLLRDLYQQFDRWDLALAAYNMGSQRIERAVALSPGASVWQLADRSLLPKSTRTYVSNVLATTLVASQPERYGLANIGHYEPLRYDTFVVSHRLEVATIASLCERSSTEVAALNPALRSGVAPVGFQVRLPKGTKDRFAANYAAWRTHQAG